MQRGVGAKRSAVPTCFSSLLAALWLSPTSATAANSQTSYPLSSTQEPHTTPMSGCRASGPASAVSWLPRPRRQLQENAGSHPRPPCCLSL